MIRSNSEQLAQVQWGAFDMLLIMHCWHYVCDVAYVTEVLDHDTFLSFILVK